MTWPFRNSNLYSRFLTFAMVTFSKITANTELGNIEPLFLGEIGD